MNLKEQHATLKKYFPATKITLPKIKLGEAPKEFDKPLLLPHWTLIAKTYGAAVKKVIEAIEKSRNTYNYLATDDDHLRELPRKKELMKPYVDTTIVLHAQSGERWLGKSVEEVRKNLDIEEIPFGIYEAGIMMLLYPDRLKKYEDPWIDCVGDEYAPDGDGQFIVAPLFVFHGGWLGSGTGRFGHAVDRYGSASGFLAQSDTRTFASLGTFDSSSLEFRVAALEEKVRKIKEILS